LYQLIYINLDHLDFWILSDVGTARIHGVRSSLAMQGLNHGVGRSWTDESVHAKWP
jgi:hypothetical protein